MLHVDCPPPLFVSVRVSLSMICAQEKAPLAPDGGLADVLNSIPRVPDKFGGVPENFPKDNTGPIPPPRMLIFSEDIVVFMEFPLQVGPVTLKIADTVGLATLPPLADITY